MYERTDVSSSDGAPNETKLSGSCACAAVRWSALLDGVSALNGEERTDGAPVAASPEERSRSPEAESLENTHVERGVPEMFEDGAAEPCAIEPGPLARDRAEVTGDDRRNLLATDGLKLVYRKAAFPKHCRDAYVVLVAELGVEPELGQGIPYRTSAGDIGGCEEVLDWHGHSTALNSGSRLTKRRSAASASESAGAPR